MGVPQSQLSDEVNRQNSTIPGQINKDTLDFYVCTYGSIDVLAVWATLAQDVPGLRQSCEEIPGL